MTSISICFILLQFLLEMQCDTAPSIIIVGAGSAGIAAATRLLENNLTNIKILEAEERIGGRIHSVQFGDGIIDLGAQWCHGDPNNAIRRLVNDLNVLAPTDWSETFYHSSRTHVDQDFCEELIQVFGKINAEKNSVEELSVGEYVINRYHERITELYGQDPDKLVFASEFLSVLQNRLLFNKGGFSWYDLSHKIDFEEPRNSIGLNWKGRGFKILLDVLMKAYPNPAKKLPIDDKIILKKEVTRISWHENAINKISIKCFDGSIFNADHIILTTSLGVLKDRYNALFNPPLPQEKMDAIIELGIAASAKVYFHFPQRWWPRDNFKSISLFWSNEDRLQLVQECKVSHKFDRTWVLNLFKFYPAENNPNVLEGIFVGELIPEIELLSDSEIIDGAMFVLKKFVGHKFENLVKPDAIIRTKWYSNPHFKGAYSYQTVNSRKRNISGEVALSKPITDRYGNPIILFAGEATSPTHYGTAHGAVETGFREADRILKLYK